MASLRAVTENQIRAFLNVSDDEFIKLQNPAPEDMHDPGEYSDMVKFAAYLFKEKERQVKDPSKILGMFGDYDTDGICSSAISGASLNVFGFRYIIGIPTMDDGYGLSPSAVDRLIQSAEKQGYKLDMIITADNGIKADDGIAYAAGKGITVLVTDHHPAGNKLPQGASVCIDPWKKDDKYPFKYNSGATVIWKAMLQYAMTYEQESLPLIRRLIVFAGMSNIADGMLITDENRYMVVAAVKALDEIRYTYDYRKIADTEYEIYNTVFWGLHDLIYLLQEDKDRKRLQKQKSSVPLPSDEELITWYLSPMLNAPRRVHETCFEGISAFLVPDHKTRQDIIRNLIELNSIKTELRDKVLNAVNPENMSPVMCVNTRAGIGGLIAGKLSENSEMPSIVFTKRDDDSEEVIYDTVPEKGTLTASARSNGLCPLDRLMNEVNRAFPGMIKGGGHATAAGMTIDAKNYAALKDMVPDICKRIIEENKAAGVPVAENKVRILYSNMELSVEFVRIEEGVPVAHVEYLDLKLFAKDVADTCKFLESLRPFGEGFEAETDFEFVFDSSVTKMDWNPDFYDTFKFKISGVEFLTFDKEWGEKVKEDLEAGKQITAKAKIAMNTFRGRTTPQFKLSPV